MVGKGKGHYSARVSGSVSECECESPGRYECGCEGGCECGCECECVPPVPSLFTLLPRQSSAAVPARVTQTVLLPFCPLPSLDQSGHPVIKGGDRKTCQEDLTHICRVAPD